MQVGKDRRGVTTVVQTGPPEQITDPVLFRNGIQASKKFIATNGDQEPLYEGTT